MIVDQHRYTRWRDEYKTQKIRKIRKNQKRLDVFSSICYAQQLFIPPLTRWFWAPSVHIALLVFRCFFFFFTSSNYGIIFTFAHVPIYFVFLFTFDRFARKHIQVRTSLNHLPAATVLGHRETPTDRATDRGCWAGGGDFSSDRPEWWCAEDSAWKHNPGCGVLYVCVCVCVCVREYMRVRVWLCMSYERTERQIWKPLPNSDNSGVGDGSRELLYRIWSEQYWQTKNKKLRNTGKLV